MRTTLLTVAGLIVTCICVLSGYLVWGIFQTTSGAPLSPGSLQNSVGQFTFVAETTHRQGLFSLHSDGSALQQLSDLKPVTVAWSPDGQQLAFAGGGYGQQDMYVMQADGTQLTRLTNNQGGEYDPTWSPDGTRIAFTSQYQGNQDIYVMHADGTGQKPLTHGTGRNRIPAWSPDGTHIAFISTRNNEQRVYVMQADGTRQTALSPADASAYMPVWSPDSTRLVCTLHRESADLAIINVQSQHTTYLTTSWDEDRSPVWSPDGSRIAFTRESWPFIESVKSIYIIQADGTGLKKVSGNDVRVHTWPSWSPDGSVIAFIGIPTAAVSQADYGVYLVRLDENKMVHLVEVGPANASRDIVWRPREH